MLLDLSIHLSIHVDSGLLALYIHVHPVLTTPENFELTITGALQAVTFLRLYKTHALYELYLRDPRRQNRLTCRLAPGKLPPYLCGVQKVTHTRAQFISTCAPFDAYKAPPSAACHFKKNELPTQATGSAEGLAVHGCSRLPSVY